METGSAGGGIRTDRHYGTKRHPHAKIEKFLRLNRCLDNLFGFLVAIHSRKFPLGDKSVTWNGLDRAGKRVKGGVYRAHLVARSAFGTVELAKTFTVRQIVGPPKGS